MMSRRRNRLITVLFALFSLLFMQWAVASYVCPGSAIDMASIAAIESADMPCAGSMGAILDEQQPNVCHAYCQPGQQQTADNTQPPGVAALMALATLATWNVAFPAPRTAPAPVGAAMQMPLLRRTTAPPLAVQHCCFLI